MSDIALSIHDLNRSEVELFRRVSWGAIFGGVLVALSVELVFLTFGLFIGFQMKGGEAVAWTEAWYLTGVFCSLLVGSWVAARFAGNPNRGNGLLHGFVVWGLTMFTTAAIAVALSWDVIRVASSWLQSAISTGAAGAAGAAPGNLTQAATNAAGDISSTALVVFGGLILAAVGSFIGGAWAAPRSADFAPAHTPHLPEQPHHA